MVKKFKIKKDDEVVVIAGRDKGKKGKVVRVVTAENRIVVSGVNMVKRHKRADRTGAGGIIEQEAALHISNVALADPKDGAPTRVGYRVLEDGRKVRFAKKSGEVVNA